MEQRILPLWRHVIFVDWHGVLSRDPFWTSILHNLRHPLRSRLEAKLSDIFAPGAPTGHDWMRGTRSSDDIVSAMAIELPANFKPDYLRRRLDEDCRRMTVNVELLDILRAARQRTPVAVVIATDNMDCFASAFAYLQHHTRRPYAATARLADWIVYCDDIICSSDLGTLKSENPDRFFGTWLDQHELSFADALLIDDRADNCAAFEQHGGTAVRWKMGTGDPADAATSIETLLATPAEHMATAPTNLPAAQPA